MPYLTCADSGVHCLGQTLSYTEFVLLLCGLLGWCWGSPCEPTSNLLMLFEEPLCSLIDGYLCPVMHLHLLCIASLITHVQLQPRIACLSMFWIGTVLLYRCHQVKTLSAGSTLSKHTFALFSIRAPHSFSWCRISKKRTLPRMVLQHALPGIANCAVSYSPRLWRVHARW